MSQQFGQPRPLLAMVALNTPSLPSPIGLLEHLQTIAGITVDPRTVRAKEEAIVFGLDQDNAAIALVPAPIPWPNLEGPCATAWWWPEATEKMKPHNSHILVALGGDAGDLIRRHIALTQLTAAVASDTNAAGIYWGGGRLVHDPRAFIEQSHDLSPHHLPLPLWIDFRVESNDDETYRLFTTGMRAFDKDEIEIPHSQKQPSEIFDFACSIANHIITANPDIQDGHTVGRSETEQIRVTYAPSMWDAAITVLRLDFG